METIAGPDALAAVRVRAIRPSHLRVAILAAQLLPVSTIASTLGLSRHTVNSALADVRTHLGIARTVDLVHWLDLLRVREAEAAADAARGPALMTTAEVAAKLRVDPKTVSRWGVAGRIARTRLPGGQWRYPREAVEAIANAGEDGAAA